VASTADQPFVDDTQRLYDAQRGRLWGLAYRLTGSSADADDVVQETFARLLQREPSSDDGKLPGWLTRVATNLAIDTLRARKRHSYDGPWLPQPVELDDEAWLIRLRSDRPDPETRYSTLESITFAFLVALEALPPRQRAALVLRDVLGYSAVETAALLDTSEGNVRVLHLRARTTMSRYDASRCVPSTALKERHRKTLTRFIGCLLSQDTRGLEALLVESTRTITDAAGEYTALATPLVGRRRVARLYLRALLLRQQGEPSIQIVTANGLPAITLRLARPARRQAPRSMLLFDLDGEGRIRSIYTILASAKLSAMRTLVGPSAPEP
jgi:RNA polymerase sigma-70 factor (ECF subfamily)